MFPSHDTIREASDRVHTDSAARQHVEIYSWRHEEISSATRRTRSHTTDGVDPTESPSEYCGVSLRLHEEAENSQGA